MQIDREELVKTFANISDDELLERWKGGTLTDIAKEIAEQELTNRKLTYSDLEFGLEAINDGGIKDPGGLVTVGRFVVLVDAQIVRARLEAEGIPAILPDEHLVNAHFGLTGALGLIRIQVRRQDASRATEILKLIEDGDFTIEETDPTLDLSLKKNDILAHGDAFLAYTQDISYLQRWKSMTARSAWFAGPNFYAMIFGSSWFAFRKMYGTGVFVMLASILCVYTPALVWINLKGMPAIRTAELMMLGMLCAIVFIRIPAGLFANTIYFRKVVRTIAEIKDNYDTTEAVRDAIKERGGVSLGTGMLFVFLTFTISLVIRAVTTSMRPYL